MLNDSQTTESQPTGETLAGGLWQGVCEVELMVREKPNVNGQRDDGKGAEGVACEGNQSELLKNGNRKAHASIAGPRMTIKARESGCMSAIPVGHAVKLDG
jgi:hypothetical protein